MVFFLLKADQNHLAFEILKQEKINPNSKDLRGVPLICAAIESKHWEMVDYLISSGADLNVYHPLQNQNSPLHQAVIDKNKKLIESLLKNPRINLEMKNSEGWTPIAYAINQSTLFDLLKAKGAVINYQTAEGSTLLTKVIYSKMLDRIEMLLQSGIDPNLGKPSALVQAIDTLNIDLVQRLLEAGGQPFKRDKSGLVPFIQALLKGSPEMVKLMIDRTDCNFDVEDKNGISPLIAALTSGNKEKIELLKKQNIQFPLTLEGKSKDMVQVVLHRLESIGNYQALKELLEWNHFRCSDFEYLVIDHFHKKNVRLVYELEKLKCIHPNTLIKYNQ